MEKNRTAGFRTPFFCRENFLQKILESLFLEKNGFQKILEEKTTFSTAVQGLWSHENQTSGAAFSPPANPQETRGGKDLFHEQKNQEYNK